MQTEVADIVDGQEPGMQSRSPDGLETFFGTSRSRVLSFLTLRFVNMHAVHQACE